MAQDSKQAALDAIEARRTARGYQVFDGDTPLSPDGIDLTAAIYFMRNERLNRLHAKYPSRSA